MKIQSIQIGLPKEVEFRGRKITTGIFKEPVAGPVMVRQTNIEGDGQADLRVHGGIHKAVYAYGADAFPSWKSERPQNIFAAGSFGENLTVELLREDEILIGDTFEIGEAILQAVQPRFPCFKLGIKFQDPSILKDFMRVNRPGIYFSVLREGNIESGQSFRLINREPESISIRRLFELTQVSDPDPAEIAKVLRIRALPPGVQSWFTMD